jgi:hypothetical protein
MRIFVAVCIGMATLGLSAGYGLTGRWAWMTVILLIGLLWLTEPWHGGRWMATLALVLFTATAGVGVLLGLPAFWLLTSLVIALAAWDSDHFANYLADVPDIRNETQLTARHLRRLGFVCIPGWFLGIVALNVQVRLNFVLTLALALLIIIALSGAIRQMRQEGGQE